MLWIFGDDTHQQRARLGGFFLTQQALAEMRARVYVQWIALHRGAVAGLGQSQFALLEINVAKLRVMVRLVEVMDLRLKFLDAAAVICARQFKSARGRRRGAIDGKVIKQSGQSGK